MVDECRLNHFPTNRAPIPVTTRINVNREHGDLQDFCILLLIFRALLSSERFGGCLQPMAGLSVDWSLVVEGVRAVLAERDDVIDFLSTREPADVTNGVVPIQHVASLFLLLPA